MEIKKNLRKIAELGMALTAIATLILAGCGGGGGGNSNANVSSSAAVVLNDLVTTNLANMGFPWSGPFFSGVDKRWDITTLIPVKTNGESRAGPAMDAIEAKLAACRS